MDCLNKGKTKLKNGIKCFEMTSNSKHRTEKIKTKIQRIRNMKSQNTKRRKPSFTKRIGRKCKLISGIELSDSGSQIMNHFLYVLNQKQHFFNFFMNHK